MARCDFSRPRRAEKDDVGLGLDEVEGAKVDDHFLADRALIGEVEILERLVSREARRLDAVLASVGLTCRQLPLEAV